MTRNREMKNQVVFPPLFSNIFWWFRAGKRMVSLKANNEADGSLFLGQTKVNWFFRTLEREASTLGCDSSTCSLYWLSFLSYVCNIVHIHYHIAVSKRIHNPWNGSYQWATSVRVCHNKDKLPREIKNYFWGKDRFCLSLWHQVEGVRWYVGENHNSWQHESPYQCTPWGLWDKSTKNHHQAISGQNGFFLKNNLKCNRRNWTKQNTQSAPKWHLYYLGFTTIHTGV